MEKTLALYKMAMVDVDLTGELGFHFFWFNYDRKGFGVTNVCAGLRRISSENRKSAPENQKSAPDCAGFFSGHFFMVFLIKSGFLVPSKQKQQFCILENIQL